MNSSPRLVNLYARKKAREAAFQAAKLKAQYATSRTMRRAAVNEARKSTRNMHDIVSAIIDERRQLVKKH